MQPTTLKDKQLCLLQEKLETHIQQFDEHIRECDERWDHIIESQQQTNDSIDKLVKCTSDLHESTKGVVEAWETGTGVIKFGGAVGRFIKWLAGFAVLGGVISWLTNHLKP